MRKIIFILVFNFIFPFNLVFGQNTNDFSFHLAFPFLNNDFEKYPWSKCISDYPEFGLSSISFSQYSTFGNPNSFEGGQIFVPTSLGLEYGRAITGKKHDFWNRSSHRFRLSVEVPINAYYENNMEYTEFQGTSMDSYDIVDRDFYEISMYALFLHCSYGIQHFSNYKGKKDNIRFYAGAIVIQGVSFGEIYLTHTSGLYEKEVNSSGSFYYRPYGIVEPEKTEDLIREKRWLNGFSFLFGVEYLVGKKQRWHVGFDYSVGNVWLFLFNKSAISSGYFSGGVNLRYKLIN